MNVTLKPSIARGIVAAPPSKSMAHRLLISAALSEGESVIHGISGSQDILATLDCLRTLGADCQQTGNTVRVRGIDPRKATPQEALCTRESGSTLRFLIPIAWLSGNAVTLHGAPSLMARPMEIFSQISREKSLQFEQNGQDILVRGPLVAGEYRVAGNVSSQFISGLLFALPLTDGDSVIRITPPVESRSYLDLTVSALRAFGVQVEWSDAYTLSIRGNQSYHATELTVEGDYSNAAFLDAFHWIGGEVSVEGLREDSLQGDRVFRRYFAALDEGMPTLSIGDCPDLGPILFTLAAMKNGAIFTETRRLRIKESDRVATMARELAKFGAELTVGEDRVCVHPAVLHAPTEPLEGHNDHRIVMSMAVLASRFGGQILGAEAVAKSYPDFFDVLRSLGVDVQTNI